MLSFGSFTRWMHEINQHFWKYPMQLATSFGSITWRRVKRRVRACTFQLLLVFFFFFPKANLCVNKLGTKCNIGYRTTANGATKRKNRQTANKFRTFFHLFQKKKEKAGMQSGAARLIMLRAGMMFTAAVRLKDGGFEGGKNTFV